MPQESIELKHLITYLHRFGFRWTVFGFYWLKALDPSMMDLFFKKESQERLLELYVACTVGMLRIVYGHNAMLLRQGCSFMFRGLDPLVVRSYVPTYYYDFGFYTSARLLQEERVVRLPPRRPLGQLHK